MITNILAFDPSLTGTGWAMLSFAGDKPHVVARGTIVTEPHPDRKGLHDTMPRVDVIFRSVCGVIDSLEIADCYVHEMANISGHRTDASLLSGAAVRCGIQSRVHPGARILQISASKWQRHLTGITAPSKAEIKKKVMERLGQDLRMNTNVSDAIGIALTVFDLRLYEEVDNG